MKLMKHLSGNSTALGEPLSRRTARRENPGPSIAGAEGRKSIQCLSGPAPQCDSHRDIATGDGRMIDQHPTGRLRGPGGRLSFPRFRDNNRGLAGTPRLPRQTVRLSRGRGVALARRLSRAPKRRLMKRVRASARERATLSPRSVAAGGSFLSILASPARATHSFRGLSTSLSTSPAGSIVVLYLPPVICGYSSLIPRRSVLSGAPVDRSARSRDTESIFA